VHHDGTSGRQATLILDRALCRRGQGSSRFTAPLERARHRMVHWGISSTLLVLTLFPAQAQELPQPQPEPPSITSLRHTEDYSYLREPQNRSGAWWEPYKFVPLDPYGFAYVTLAMRRGCVTSTIGTMSSGRDLNLPRVISGRATCPMPTCISGRRSEPSDS
jgi:hypothetical protein